MNLYQLDNEFRALLAAIADQEGELTPAQEAALELGEERFIGKAAEYTHAIIMIEAEARAAREQANRLKELSVRREALAERLRQRLTAALLLRGRRLHLDTADLTVRTTQAVQIAPDAQIPPEFLEVKTVSSPRKVELKKALEAGAAIAGVSLVENHHLQIR